MERTGFFDELPAHSGLILFSMNYEHGRLGEHEPSMSIRSSPAIRSEVNEEGRFISVALQRRCLPELEYGNCILVAVGSKQYNVLIRCELPYAYIP
jgi:hypothetical protein